MSAKRLLGVSMAAMLLVVVHAGLSTDPFTLLVVDGSQSAGLVLQIEDVSYAVAPGARPAVTSRGQLRYQVQLFSEACGPLRSFVASAGDEVVVTVLPDSSVEVETGVPIESAQVAVAHTEPPCSTTGGSIEILLRNALLGVAALSGALGLGVLLWRRTAG